MLGDNCIWHLCHATGLFYFLSYKSLLLAAGRKCGYNVMEVKVKVRMKKKWEEDEKVRGNEKEIGKGKRKQV